MRIMFLENVVYPIKTHGFWLFKRKKRYVFEFISPFHIFLLLFTLEIKIIKFKNIKFLIRITMLKTR